MLAFYISSSSLGGPPEVNDDRGYAAQEGTTDPRCLLISFFINSLLSFFLLFICIRHLFLRFVRLSDLFEGRRIRTFRFVPKGLRDKRKKEENERGEKELRCAVNPASD